jgi:hypothetical protein
VRRRLPWAGGGSGGAAMGPRPPRRPPSEHPRARRGHRPQPQERAAAQSHAPAYERWRRGTRARRPERWRLRHGHVPGHRGPHRQSTPERVRPQVPALGASEGGGGAATRPSPPERRRCQPSVPTQGKRQIQPKGRRIRRRRGRIRPLRLAVGRRVEV